MVGIHKKDPSHSEDTMEGHDNLNKISDEESNSDSDSESEEVRAEPAKNAIYNRDGLLEKLEDISWPENVEWIHKLTVDHDQAEGVDVNDDLGRELAFYTQALDGTRKAFDKLQGMKIPFLRPPDYYAEMVKSDAHMLKVKGRVLSEKKRIEEAEERKKMREAKKVAKEVQAQKTKERAKRKKEEIESVKKWRKQRQQSGFAKGKDDEMDLGFDGDDGFARSKKRKTGVAPGDRSGGIRRGGKKGQEKNRKKRDYRDSKFGHGGRKGVKKQNTAETTNDLRGFNKGGMSKKRNG
ncbi:putative rRNA-processing protein EBP [Ananas comosus]|uniref:Putative rRNA-processing protein EBP n=1 Tax=Ananas comosus TaxID=4615 RepID=A0A199W5F3_ANACO|nr:putative rRNA-processing protein EBP [Ananas comosus]